MPAAALLALRKDLREKLFIRMPSYVKGVVDGGRGAGALQIRRDRTQERKHKPPFDRLGKVYSRLLRLSTALFRTVLRLAVCLWRILGETFS